MPIKTHIIKYLPSSSESNTAKLLNKYISLLPAGNDYSVHDLLTSPPTWFNNDSLSTYIKKGYLNEELNQYEQEIYNDFIKYIKQLKDADVIVVVTPMYNFSLPGLVKTYFDAVTIKGETWDIDEGGNYVGKLQRKKFILLSTCGGVYHAGKENLNHLSSLVKSITWLWGIKDAEVILAEGMALTNVQKEESLLEARHKVKELVEKWYE